MTDRPEKTPLKRTPLYDRHVALGAKLIDFGGWEMPLQYAGILEEHRTVREAIGLFDVSHMGEIFFEGADATKAVQRCVTADVARLEHGQAAYCCTLRPNGGIVDDCIVYCGDEEHYLIIVNASNIEKDFAHFEASAAEVAPRTVVRNRSDGNALIAVQGPRAIELVSSVAQAVPAKPFTFVQTFLDHQVVHIARTGYTGEDGVEIVIETERSRPELIWDLLLEKGKALGAKPIGLGARDTLRLEARLCLYGNDIDEEHNPIEAGLGWSVKGTGYVGEEVVARARKEGSAQKLVGFKVIGRGIARHGYALHVQEPGGAEGEARQGEKIGVVTSGTVAPTVGGAIGMGWVPPAYAEPGTRLVADCRGRPALVEIVKGPFYKRSK